MQPVEFKVLNRIYGHGRGWAFSKNDFADLGSSAAVDQALSRLTRQGTVRRVIRGLYDYPKYSKLLDKALSPDVDQAAQALARKFGWKIQISGNAALNILGLSTQIPGRFLYLSDGRTCSYQLGAQELSFKKAPLKDMGVRHPQSALLVQALKALDKRSLNKGEKTRVLAHFDSTTRIKILKDTRYVTSWVYEQIKGIFQG